MCSLYICVHSLLLGIRTVWEVTEMQFKLG